MTTRIGQQTVIPIRRQVRRSETMPSPVIRTLRRQVQVHAQAVHRPLHLRRDHLLDGQDRQDLN